MLVTRSSRVGAIWGQGREGVQGECAYVSCCKKIGLTHTDCMLLMNFFDTGLRTSLLAHDILKCFILIGTSTPYIVLNQYNAALRRLEVNI
jgi:hypothetical protein